MTGGALRVGESLSGRSVAEKGKLVYEVLLAFGILRRGGGFMTQTVELPENVWAALQRAAQASGVTPADWIARQLLHPASANGAIAPKQTEPTEVNGQLEEQVVDNLDELNNYVSVPPKTVGYVKVKFVMGGKIPPMHYPVDELPE
jgi:hypothetical protein